MEIQNFRGIRNYSGDFSIEFGSILTVLDGENGFGKTTIFDAIEFCFTGKVKRLTHGQDGDLHREGRPKSILKHEDNPNAEAIVSIHLVKDDGHFSITRKIRSDQEGSMDNEVYDVVDGIDALNKLKITSDNFKDIFYIPQANSISLLESSKDGFKKFFDKLFNTEEESNFRSDLMGKTGVLFQVGNLIGRIREKNIQIKARIEDCQERLRKLKSENVSADLRFKEIPSLKHFSWHGGLNRKYVNGDFNIADPSCVLSKWNVLLKLLVSKDLAYGFHVNDFIAKSVQSLENIADSACELMSHEESVKGLAQDDEDLLVADYGKIVIFRDNFKLLEDGGNGLANIEWLFPSLTDYRERSTIPYFKELEEIEGKFQGGRKLIDKKSAEEKRYYQAFSSLISFWENAYVSTSVILKVTKTGAISSDDICPLCATPDTKSQIAEQIAYLKEMSNIRQDQKHQALRLLYSEGLFLRLDGAVKDLDDRIKRISRSRRLYASEDYRKLKILLKKYGLEPEVTQVRLDIETSKEVQDANRNLIGKIRRCLDDSKIPESEEFNRDDFEKYSESFFSVFEKRYGKESSDQCFGMLDTEDVKNNIQFFQNEHKKLLNLEFEKLSKELPPLLREREFYQVRIEFLEKAREVIQCYSDGLKSEIDNFRKSKVENISLPTYIFAQRMVKKYDGMIVYLTDNSIRLIGKGESYNPLFGLSSGQLEGLMISVMLANNVNQNLSPLMTLFIDDPIQSLDDLNVLSFVNLMRYQFGNRQIIISTHDDDFSELVRYKFWRLYGDKAQVKINTKRLFLSSVANKDAQGA